MLLRCFRYLRGVRLHVAGGMLLLILAALLEVALPWPVKWLIDSVFGQQPLPAWLAWLAWAPGFGPGEEKGRAALTIAVIVVVLGVAHKTLTMLSQLWMIHAGNRMVRELRVQTLDRLYRLPLEYHDRSKVGDLLYRTAYDSYALQSLLSGVLVPMFSGLCVSIGVIVVMLRTDATLTLITAATAPLLWLNIKGYEHRIAARAKRFHESEGALAANLQESLSSIRVIQAFTMEAGNNRVFSEQADTSVRENLRKSGAELSFGWVIGVIMAIGTAAVVWVGARAVLEGRLFPGDVLIFLAYLGTLYQPLNAFSQGAGVFHSASGQLARVFEILDSPVTIDDRPSALQPDTLRGKIEFDQVSFAYEEGRPALDQVSFQVEPGGVLALVGRTGSGKSTTASLLLRFYDPDQGRVLIDDHDLRDLGLAWLRSRVSIVFQEPFLFSATIRENIALGRPGASDEAIELACRRAQADEFIRRLPQGYDTPLGERGVNLSGGQRQRLSIARAFLKDAPLLILDEPTSALDPATERELLGALEELMAGRTTIIIAHRLSTIRRADRIGVFENGRMVEFGTPAALMAARGVFHDLASTQNELPGSEHEAPAPSGHSPESNPDPQLLPS
jgi:ATP-binding cassette subfamily B protein/subfamily B ATP-binding cassette protein MsbA